LPALQVFNRVELWQVETQVTERVQIEPGVFKFQTRPDMTWVTLGHLLTAAIVITITFVTARNLPGCLHMVVLSRLPIDRGGRHAVAIICRYLTVLAGAIVACRTIGMTWSSVQWLAAAMTVGLGFGLQEIFANLVSGIIILFERPIRIGDLVTVSNTTGHVTRMQIRATTITDFDRRELVVPNKKFITDDVINWTLSDPITRVVIPVGVAYGSDTKLAHDTLMKVALAHPLVLREPAPSAVFTGFGASTLDFQLRFFIGSREVYSKTLHELNTAIDKAFREARVEIAFPQQDLHIRSAEPLLEALRGRRGDEAGRQLGSTKRGAFEAVERAA
jgi:potassium efflux system protein